MILYFVSNPEGVVLPTIALLTVASHHNQGSYAAVTRERKELSYKKVLHRPNRAERDLKTQGERSKVGSYVSNKTGGWGVGVEQALQSEGSGNC